MSHIYATWWKTVIMNRYRQVMKGLLRELWSGYYSSSQVFERVRMHIFIMHKIILVIIQSAKSL